MTQKSETKSILIVEDNSLNALELRTIIKYMGYKVCGTARNYTHSIEQIRELQPDLVLLDIDLNEKKSGIDIANYINKHFKTPFIYVTSAKDLETIYKARVTDPLGYIIKPFKEEDIIANIELAFYKANTNEKYENPENRLDLGGGYFFDEKENELYYKALNIQITKKEKQLLKILIENRGVVPYSKLEYEIWGDKVVSLGALRTLVSRLNEKINFKIESIRSEGYRLI